MPRERDSMELDDKGEGNYGIGRQGRWTVWSWMAKKRGTMELDGKG